jgi:hypothetical protein
MQKLVYLYYNILCIIILQLYYYGRRCRVSEIIIIDTRILPSLCRNFLPNNTQHSMYNITYKYIGTYDKNADTKIVTNSIKGRRMCSYIIKKSIGQNSSLNYRLQIKTIYNC